MITILVKAMSIITEIKRQNDVVVMTKRTERDEKAIAKVNAKLESNICFGNFGWFKYLFLFWTCTTFTSLSPAHVYIATVPTVFKSGVVRRFTRPRPTIGDHTEEINMAQRRMFSQRVVETDRFLDMALTAQTLYFHLGMYADDDGFVGNPKSVRRMIGASEDDLKALVEKGYLIVFEDGVVAIRDWLVSNYVKKDRYTPTIYTADRQLLAVDRNRRYQLASEVTPETTVEPEWIQNGSKMDPQDRSGQERLGQSEDQDSLNQTTAPAETKLKGLHVALNPTQRQLLSDYIRDLSAPVVDFAIDSMARHAEQPRFAYLDRILNRYRQSGICTRQAAQADDDRYHGKQAPTRPGPIIPIYQLGEWGSPAHEQAVQQVKDDAVGRPDQPADQLPGPVETEFSHDQPQDQHPQGEDDQGEQETGVPEVDQLQEQALQNIQRQDQGDDLPEAGRQLLIGAQSKDDSPTNCKQPKVKGDD